MKRTVWNMMKMNLNQVNQNGSQFHTKKISLPAKEDQETHIIQSHDHSFRQTSSYHSTNQISASFTVEAAIGLPILIFFLAFLIFFFRMFLISQAVENALAYTGRTMAAQAVQKEGGLVEAKLLFSRKAAKTEEIGDFVFGGMAGISLAGSEFTATEIRLKAAYVICFPIHFFGKENYPMTQTIVCRKWNGWMDETDAEKMVYITPSGSVYHLSRSCRYLDLSIQPVSKAELLLKRNKDGSKYKKCGACCSRSSKTYYITDYGEEYHEKLSCSALKRTVYMVPLSQAAGRGCCSKCGN